MVQRETRKPSKSNLKELMLGKEEVQNTQLNFRHTASSQRAANVRVGLMAHFQ